MSVPPRILEAENLFSGFAGPQLERNLELG